HSGPDTWWVHYPSASGSMQSPVDIITEETWQASRENSNFEPLEIDYSSMGGGSNVTGGPYRHYNFLLEQIHMHWGESDKNGSEHYVNGKGYSAELHFVHWNEDLYSSYEEAARNDDGILVLAVFVQFIQKHKNTKTHTDKHTQTHTNSQPEDTSKFWTYQGSLTTPPCYESVTWVIFENCIYTSSAVLKKYRELKYYAENETRPDDEFDGQLKTNNRPVQPIGVRKVRQINSQLID
ncbi:hypothetical protein HELRODRAFT_72210, partial [Helobdella robusta]|uniref:Carbonic anhydrase n=1 Tax=Helobdella robusta TaxID=6412 RepID=T1G0X2_HELRO